MAKTTVSVSTEARDTFAAVVAGRNTTMFGLLEETARRLEREEDMRQATLDYERLVRCCCGAAASRSIVS